MAKVTGPLMSIEASGQFAESIVFDKRGFARGYTIPSNPRTNSQQETRLAMKAAQYAAKHLNATTRATLQGISGYRWNASLLSEALGTNLTNWHTAQDDEFPTLDVDDLAAIQAVVTTLKMTKVTVPEFNGEVEANLCLYVVLRAYNRLTAPARPVAVTDIATLFT